MKYGAGALLSKNGEGKTRGSGWIFFSLKGPHISYAAAAAARKALRCHIGDARGGTRTHSAVDAEWI